MAGIVQVAEINLVLCLSDHFFTGNGQHRALSGLSHLLKADILAVKSSRLIMEQTTAPTGKVCMSAYAKLEHVIVR